MAASSSNSSTSVVPQSKVEFEMAERKLPQVSIGEMLREEEHNERMGPNDDEPLDPTLSTSQDRYQVRVKVDVATISSNELRSQMDRMGKQQVLVRHFRPMATFSFNAMATCVWEFGIFSVNQGYDTDGLEPNLSKTSYPLI